MADERLLGTQRVVPAVGKGYDTRDFVAFCRALKITPHVAQNHARFAGSTLYALTSRHPDFTLSQRIREKIG